MLARKPGLKVSNVYEVSGYGCRGSHSWANKMGTATLALPSLKVTVGS